MHRRFAALAATLVLALSATGVSAAAPPASRDATASSAVLDKTSAIVVLKQQPVATYDGHIAGYAKTKVSNGKLNPNSAAVKKYVGTSRPSIRRSPSGSRPTSRAPRSPRSIS